VLRHKINKSRVESYEEILCKQYRRKGEKNLFFVFFIIPRNIFLNQKIFQPFPTLFHVCAANALSMCTKEERRSLKVYVFHSTHFSKISHESTPFRTEPRLIANSRIYEPYIERYHGWNTRKGSLNITSMWKSFHTNVHIHVRTKTIVALFVNSYMPLLFSSSHFHHNTARIINFSSYNFLFRKCFFIYAFYSHVFSLLCSGDLLA
jgi:hypothetical protein